MSTLRILSCSKGWWIKASEQLIYKRSRCYIAHHPNINEQVLSDLLQNVYQLAPWLQIIQGNQDLSFKFLFPLVVECVYLHLNKLAQHQLVHLRMFCTLGVLTFWNTLYQWFNSHIISLYWTGHGFSFRFKNLCAMFGWSLQVYDSEKNNDMCKVLPNLI